MNILFIVMDNQSYMHYFPLGIAYISSVLRKEGHKVFIYSQDYHHTTESNLRKCIEDLFKPDVVGIGSISGYYTYKKLIKISEVINKCKNRNQFKYVLGGHMPSADPNYFLNRMKADIVIEGEGEESIKKVCKEMKRGIYESPLIEDLDNIPFPAYDLFPINYYKLQRLPSIEPTKFSMSVISGRGCSFNCLQGDTIIDTVELGKQKIKNLIGKNVKVLTRNPTTREVEYAKAFNISKTRSNAEIIRIYFNEGSYIDCTPDHKFMTFENSNQHIKKEEQEIEAKNLKIGQSVRAIKEVHDKAGYIIIKNGRKERIRKHRLIMEAILGRKLEDKEIIHHLDKNTNNNNPKNLILTDIHSHINFHPETGERLKKLWKDKKIEHYRMTKEDRKKVSERMKISNPMYNPEITKKMASTMKKKYKNEPHPNIGNKNISKAARKRMLSKDNPMKKFKGKTIEEIYGKEKAKIIIEKRKLSRIKNSTNNIEINHKVIKIEKLPYKEDVYCMEIPGYDWFFANNVLVHNCNFCYRMMKGIRLRSINSIVEEIKLLQKDYDISYIDFADDLTMSSKQRAVELSEALMSLNIKWRCEGRLNYASEDILKIMKKSGCVFINYGIESLDNEVLKNMNKALTEDIIIKGIETTLKVGISPGLNLIWGNIGDTKETLRKSVNFLLKYDDMSQIRTISPVQPYPGCDLFNYAKEKGLVEDTQDFYENKLVNSDLLSCNFTELSDDEFHRELYRANFELLANYHKKKIYEVEKQLKKLYLEKDTSWRGWRHT